MRRSLKIRGRRKEKEKLPSGITADYSASFFAQLNRDVLENTDNSSAGTSWNRVDAGLTQSDSSETSLTSLTTNAGGKSLPPLPPKPPKRGILKGPRLSVTSVNSAEDGVLSNGNEANLHGAYHAEGASSLLHRNTMQNEVITYQNVPTHPPNLGSPGDFYSEEESSYCNIPQHPLQPHQIDSKYLQVCS